MDAGRQVEAPEDGPEQDGTRRERLNGTWVSLPRTPVDGSLWEQWVGN